MTKTARYIEPYPSSRRRTDEIFLSITEMILENRNIAELKKRRNKESKAPNTQNKRR